MLQLTCNGLCHAGQAPTSVVAAASPLAASSFGVPKVGGAKAGGAKSKTATDQCNWYNHHSGHPYVLLVQLVLG